MFKEAEALGLPKPEIIEIGMRVRFIVYLAESVTAQISMNSTEQVTEQVAEQVAEQVTEQVDRLLFCLKHEPLGSREAMQCLGLSHRPTFLYDYLKPAIQAGFVEMTQPDSPKSPTQKYRLTAKGKAFLSKKAQEDVE